MSGRHNPITDQEVQRIFSLSRYMNYSQIARAIGRGRTAVTKVIKPPKKEETRNGDFFNWKDYNNSIL